MGKGGGGGEGGGEGEREKEAAQDKYCTLLSLLLLDTSYWMCFITTFDNVFGR